MLPAVPMVESTFARARAAFLSDIEDYDEFEDPDENARAQRFCREAVDAIDAMEARTDGGPLPEALSGLLRRLDALGLDQPIQALVFFFKRTHGQLFLAGFGSLPEEAVANPGDELAHHHRVASTRVFDELGPVVFTGYVDVGDELVSEDTADELDLESEVDKLEELKILKAYSLLQAAVLDVFAPARTPNVTYDEPLFVYVEETGGGYAARLFQAES